MCDDLARRVLYQQTHFSTGLFSFIVLRKVDEHRAVPAMTERFVPHPRLCRGGKKCVMSTICGRPVATSSCRRALPPAFTLDGIFIQDFPELAGVIAGMDDPADAPWRVEVSSGLEMPWLS